MFSMFSVFNHNLNQLSFRLLLTDCQNIGDVSIHVFNTYIQLNIDLKVILLKFNSIEFKPISLRQLNAFYVNCNQKDDKTCLQIVFTVSAQMESIPLKPSFPKTPLPVNSELMNDWIFCHKHNDTDEECDQQKRFESVCHQLNATTIDDPIDKQMSPVLWTFDQIIHLLNETIDTKFLFETKDKNFSLVLNTFNRKMIICLTSGQQIESNSEYSVDFLNKTSVYYKVFKNSEKELNSDLNRYRFGFDVRYFVTEIQVFRTLINTLIESTKTVLPIDLRFDNQLNLFFGFI